MQTLNQNIKDLATPNGEKSFTKAQKKFRRNFCVENWWICVKSNEFCEALRAENFTLATRLAFDLIK